ncbi:MAG TPA: peptide chain release factor-like protein [Pirellulaceae bacterium]|jgi:hypothetical protein|nr:peptide chain release factor-like protein [Pirellulaceae bacterium]
MIAQPTPTTHPAALAEEQLIQECQSRRQRRSGPGGQHRNKVETAVVLTHLPSGIRGEASERRSQEQNRVMALFRLRVNLALEVRMECDLTKQKPSDLWQNRCRSGRIAINTTHVDFPQMLAEALDVLAASEFDVKAAAKWLACSTTQLVKLLHQESRAIQAVNRRRRDAGLYPLR